MPNLRDIKRRIKSVKNTQQITKAMKMVAASRIRKAEDQLKAARPYAEKLKEVVFDLTAGLDEVLHPLMEVRKVENIAVIVVSSDKGLCGAYNNNLLRMAWKELNESPPDKLVAILEPTVQGADVYLVCLLELVEQFRIAQFAEYRILRVEAVENVNSVRARVPRSRRLAARTVLFTGSK